MSFQTYLLNRTPFSVEKLILPSEDGQESVLVVVSSTFVANIHGTSLRLSDVQTSIKAADEYNGSPEFGSIRYESDIAQKKLFVDVLINGHAHAPRGRRTDSVMVKLMIGDVRKELVVSGDRRWLKRSFGLASSNPKSFDRMPIIYERAFGGVDRRHEDPKNHAAEARNLSGLGYQGVPSYDPKIESEIPNVEYPHARMTSMSDKPVPAGFGVIARGWQPRIKFAGTYDDAWLKERWPFLPKDFDPRHYQAAPLDQQSRTLKGGEAVTLLNLTPEGIWQFRLPTLDIPVRLYFDDRQEQISLRMDTILIEPDDRRVTMTSRVCVRTVRNKGALREIVVGHTTKGWLRAKAARKTYMDFGGNDGTLTKSSNFKL